MLPWYLLCSTLGFLGIITHKYPLYRAYIGIFQRGTLVGVHPTIPWPYPFTRPYWILLSAIVLLGAQIAYLRILHQGSFLVRTPAATPCKQFKKDTDQISQKKLHEMCWAHLHIPQSQWCRLLLLAPAKRQQKTTKDNQQKNAKNLNIVTIWKIAHMFKPGREERYLQRMPDGGGLVQDLHACLTSIEAWIFGRKKT